MKKKFLALVLTLAMVLSLVPVTALATNGTEGGASQENTSDNLTMKKTVIPNEDGTYTVRLESYATGSVIPTQAPVPMDIVLVLDVSGSMTDEIAYYTYQAINKTSWSVSDVYNAYYQKDILGIPHRTDVTYYAKIDDEYYPVSYQSKWGWGYREHWLEANNKPLGKKVTDSTWKEEVYNQELYTRQTDPNKTTKKLDAMKTAVNNFIESVAAQKNGDTPVAHRISIVKFAGTSTNKVGNDTDGDGENYTQKVTELTDVTANGSVDSLKDAVNDLTAGGATAADWGMQKAKDVLTKRGDNPNPSIVIMFTDGQPNHGSGYSKDVAGAAVDTAKTLKAAGTEVYTIGMFSEANPNDKNGNFNKYMNGVSSNYPNASGTKDRWGNYNDITLGVPADGNYYFKADNAGALDQVFQTISESTTTTSPLDASAVVVDNVPSNFALTEGSVKVYTANCIAKDGKTFKWGKETESTIRPTIDNRSISVTGFNFSKNWCGLDENNQACGQKLIIEFTISRTNYGGTQPTNAGAYIKAKADDEKEIIKLADPQVPVTIELNKTLEVNEEKYYDGEGFAILTKIAAQANTLVDGINNAYVDMKLTVKVDDTTGDTTYTYKIPAKAKTGSWYEGNSADPMTPKQIADVTTPKDVKRESNEIKPYTYNFNLKLSDKTEGGAAEVSYGPYSANFTINPALVTVKAKDKTIQAGDPKPEYDATVSGTIGEETVKYDISCAYDPATSTEGTIPIVLTGAPTQGNYNVSYENGTLTVTKAPVTTGTLKVTKEVQGENLTLDNLPDGFKITVTAGEGQEPIDLTLNGTNYTATKDEANTTATWTIPDLPAGEYTVSETGEKLKNYTCEATYHAGTASDATVTVNNANTAQNQLATDAQASQQVTVTAGSERTMTVTNTYTREVTPKPDNPEILNVSKSKTATPLDTSTWTSNVTLSLPSAEYEPVIDVVFILDDTYAGNGIFKDAATGLLNELSEKKNLDVNVGIVNFDAVARDWVAATTNSKHSGLVSLKNTEGLTALQNAIATKLDKNNDGQTKKIGATNIEWPLEMAQNMLASGKGTEKYAILFSDMYGYVYRGDLIIDGQTYENVPLSKRLYAGESKFYQGSLSMGTKYQSFADVYAHRNDEENQTTDGFFRDSSWDSYWSIYSGHMQIPTNPATEDSADPFGVPGGYSGFEKSTCLVYDRLLQMKQAGINISIVNNDFAPGDIREVGYVQSIKNDMLDTLEQKGISVIKTQENVTAEDMTNVFDTLKDQLIQVVSAGSTVTDKIGTNFDFVGLNTMSLKIGDNTIPGVIDEATNTITFKHGGKDNAHVVVYDSSADSFTWTINEDVTKDARVQLTYSVKLTKPETAAGTYGVTDLNGDGKVDGTDTTYTDTDALYTNESATMVPKDSNGKTGAELTFPKPSVSYTIKGSSGGHGGNGGGTVTIPDDVPTGLNGKDHYAYVVGYPDGMVYPQKNITRAEVATIFFRLLKDETREANMTKSNGYNDMKDGAWYTCAVSTLSKMGIIKGYEDGSFKPDASISRAEFAAIAARFDPDGDKTPATFSDVSSHWAKDEISIAANHGWIKGYEDGSFKPDQKITRAETMTLVNRVLKRLPETKDDLHKDMKTWPDNQNESAWFYLAVQEATNSHYQKLKKDGTHETWESMRETRDWAALEK